MVCDVKFEIFINLIDHKGNYLASIFCYQETTMDFSCRPRVGESWFLHHDSDGSMFGDKEIKVVGVSVEKKLSEKYEVLVTLEQIELEFSGEEDVQEFLRKLQAYPKMQAEFRSPK